MPVEESRGGADDQAEPVRMEALRGPPAGCTLMTPPALLPPHLDSKASCCVSLPPPSDRLNQVTAGWWVGLIWGYFCFTCLRHCLTAVVAEFVCLALSHLSPPPGSLPFPPACEPGTLAMKSHQKAFLYLLYLL